MQLVPVTTNPRIVAFLYELLSERPVEARISHERMPTPQEHQGFVANHPFVWWYLIEANGEWVGALEANNRNELGVSILKKWQRLGYAREALKLFVNTHPPMPPIPASRNGRWLANIGHKNHEAKVFFDKCGFRPLQETWVL